MTVVASLRLRLLLVFGILCSVTGCAHYHLGSPAGPGFRTVFVAPVANRSFAPQAAELVGAQLRTTLVRDGRLQLADNPAAAEAQIQVRLVAYERNVAAVRHDDTGRARKYAVTLSALVTVTDSAGKVLLDRRPVQATRDVFLDSGQQATEYQTLPLLAAALADAVSHAVLDTW